MAVLRSLGWRVLVREENWCEPLFALWIIQLGGRRQASPRLGLSMENWTGEVHMKGHHC
jgi:hypothetical protein